MNNELMREVEEMTVEPQKLEMRCYYSMEAGIMQLHEFVKCHGTDLQRGYFAEVLGHVLGHLEVCAKKH